mmetsp:Transcript_2196/g.4627  ORF Transcript_2196/g.4627 Transcript_2196/m.4627 type:complete len:447 (-) Transcript_2196:437-1777(-)
MPKRIQRRRSSAPRPITSLDAAVVGRPPRDPHVEEIDAVNARGDQEAQGLCVTQAIGSHESNLRVAQDTGSHERATGRPDRNPPVEADEQSAESPTDGDDDPKDDDSEFDGNLSEDSNSSTPTTVKRGPAFRKSKRKPKRVDKAKNEPDSDDPEDDSDFDGNLTEDSNSNMPKTVTHNSKPRKSQGKRKRDKKANNTVEKPKKLQKRDLKTTEKMQAVLMEARETAKKELEDEKNEIMGNVPHSIQSFWGEIGFAKWGKSYLPVLNLGPYQVPPGEARNSWMSMYQKMKEKGRSLEKMSFLVYWYGEEKRESYYSIVAHLSFIKYDDAKQKMKDFASAALKKREAGKRPTADDQQKLRALDQMLEDLAKHPDQRKRGDVEFQERHQLLSIHDVDNYIEENGLDDFEVDASDKNHVKMPACEGLTQDAFESNIPLRTSEKIEEEKPS